MGKSAKLIAFLDVSMCSDRYADERPLGLRKYQLPPISSLASKHVYGTPQSPSALPAVSPLTPAPITHVRRRSTIVLSVFHGWLPDSLCRRGSSRASGTSAPVE